MNTEKTIGQEIIEGLEEFAAAIKAKDHIPQEFNCRKISLNLRPHSYNPEAVKQTRALLG
ncbi:MAG: hypothetical protein JSS02_12860, partial [Planctomycetes bacterium]|nr:hypothetical protein [Planctomycetota bacterium]